VDLEKLTMVTETIFHQSKNISKNKNIHS